MDTTSNSSSDSSSASTNQPAKPNRRKARSLEDILHQFRPIERVSYEPFQPFQPRPAKALLPSTFPTQPHPYDYFTLFFTLNLFQIITTNTNRYANIQRIYIVEERLREWSDMFIEELHVFIGAIIYMGVHKESQIHMYWNTDFNKSIKVLYT